MPVGRAQQPHDRSAPKPSTHQNGNENLKELHRLPRKRVLHSKQKQHVECGQNDARVQREAGEQEGECDGGAEQLREVGGDDGDF